MKFKFKNLIMILSITSIVGLVGGCSKKEVEQEKNQNNIAQQETQIDNNDSLIEDTKDDEEVDVENDINDKEDIEDDNVKEEEAPQVDKVEDNKEQVENKTISEQEALAICKDKLGQIWNYDYLKVGSDSAGSDKIVTINGKQYYAIYHIDEEYDMMADFRFLVDKSSGELFYQDPSDLNKLESIDDYISENK